MQDFGIFRLKAKSEPIKSIVAFYKERDVKSAMKEN